MIEAQIVLNIIMEFRALININSDSDNELRDLLKEYFDSFYLEFDECYLLTVEDASNFIFSLKQIQSVLFSDFNISCSILVIPFIYSLFNKYVHFCKNSVRTLFEIFNEYRDEDIVRRDTQLLIEYLGKDSLDTLSGYMDNNCDANKTAEELYLHRNSFAYRLKQIVAKYGLEYNDFNSLLFIKYCLINSK